MRVFLTGATGFIGGHLLDALLANGHQVTCAVRRPGCIRRAGTSEVVVDFTRDHDATIWTPRLAGIDAVINAVGIIREDGTQTFDAIHHRAPVALFTACADAGVGRVIQISANGADRQAASRYHLSKKQADDFLAALPVSAAIAQPSVVYGADGTSAAMFTTLASLPLSGLPGGGRQALQPVHIDDLVAVVMRLLVESGPYVLDKRIPVVGPVPLTLRSFLAELGRAMGLRRRLVFPVPMPIVRLGARLAGKLPGSLLDPETLAMLERGNTADPEPATTLLGRALKPVAEFISAAEREPVRQRAQLNWLLPLLRVSIALVWIVTGAVSLGLYPVEDSYALLARVGIDGRLAPLLLYGAALMDFAIGIAILVVRRRRWLWCLQLVVILFYTAVITWTMPEFWLHPYGPLLKNLPMLAAILMLMEMEKD